MNFDLLIIGGGPAAITLAKKLGKRMSVGVVRPEDYSMIYCAMPYAVEGLLDIQKTLKSDQLLHDAGAQLIRDIVIEVDFKSKKVMTKNGKTIFYKKLVLATGAEPFLPQIEGHSLSGVSVFKTQEDMEDIISRTSSAKAAVVIGAGAIGVELAQALTKKNIQVSLVDMADSILPNLIDSDFSKEVQEELELTGVSLLLNKTVEKIQGNSSVESILLNDGNEIKADMVIFAIGMKPVTNYIKSKEIKLNRDGFAINEFMETTIADVYAVGDCASFKSGITGNLLGGKLATNAVPMARLLADNLLGATRSYSGFFNGAATKVGKLFIGGTGLKEAMAKDDFEPISAVVQFTTTFPIMPTAKNVKLKLVSDRKTEKILGAQIVSGEPVTDKIDQITMAIQYGITVSQLLGFSYSSQPWQSYYPAHNLIVRAAELLIEIMGGENE